MRARWYDPAMGQFITSDPIGFASGETNLYRYAGGDPANIVDPTGLLFGVSFEDVSNFAAGFGDDITFGGTAAIRQALGVDNVDYCSSAYDAGGYAATATVAATGVVGVRKAVGKEGLKRLLRRLADERGSIEIGPSGKPTIHVVKHASRERAKDAARNEGNEARMNHPSPRRGGPHFHGVANGEKQPVHQEYPG